ncbi:MAG: ArsA-related P-loop ATPase, partial [Myxococcota bacterium]|nr:ArsA-related P-loop ATPase [Myxococcota bacterium]
ATADNISGSQDYMATEKLYDVVNSGRYDLVVLDTPPVKNALDFLEAPGRLARFLDKRVMKWFLQPYDEGRVFGKLLMGTSAVIFRLLGYIFGREFLAELAEYFHHFRDLYEGFATRHQAVVELFGDARTAFLIVSAPNGPSLEVAEFFLEELGRRKMHNPGLIVNQRHVTAGGALKARDVLGERSRMLSADLPTHTGGQLLARLGAAHRRLRELSVIENGLVESVCRRMVRGQSIWSVPRLEEDVHDLPSLGRIGEHLCEDPKIVGTVG